MYVQSDCMITEELRYSREITRSVSDVVNSKKSSYVHSEILFPSNLHASVVFNDLYSPRKIFLNYTQLILNFRRNFRLQNKGELGEWNEKSKRWISI